MKPRSVLLLLFMLSCMLSQAQVPADYTLPTKDEFTDFVTRLGQEAEAKKLVQLRSAVKLMSYEDALHFWVGMKKDPESVQFENGTAKKVAILQWGLVVNALFGRFTNLEEPYEAETKLGWALGTYFIYQLSKIYLVTEFLLARRNFEMGYSAQPNDFFREEIGLTSLMLAFAFTYAFELSPQLMLLIGLGPYIAYALSGRFEYENQLGEGEGDLYENDGAKRFDAGLQAMIGMLIMPRLYLYFAYMYSFGKLFENSDIRMTMFRVGVAISIFNYKTNPPAEMSGY